jgi:hypothetical protein
MSRHRASGYSFLDEASVFRVKAGRRYQAGRELIWFHIDKSLARR